MKAIKGTLNYTQRNKQWRLYHKLEKREKAGFLRKLSEEDGIKIAGQLYNFMYSLGMKPDINELHVAKIKILSRVHSLFNKVKI